MWFWVKSTINNLLDKLIERIMFNYDLWKWEREKRNQGFPREWFEEE